MTDDQTLASIRIVSLALNIPGPVAVARLCAMGASAVKVEPPDGDPLQRGQPDWYRELHQGVEVICLDLKHRRDRQKLEARLDRCDLLVTASRPEALSRLGIGWPELGGRYPTLCQIAIVGDPRPMENRPGHDLTYQARAGLLLAPGMPTTPVADLGGALQAVNAALGLLLQRERSPTEDPSKRYAELSLAQAAEFFAKPLHYGLTRPGGVLGGGLPQYNLYDTHEGWIALAALEPHFWEKVQQELDVSNPGRAELERVFKKRSAAEWERWAAERDVPICAVPLHRP